MIAVTLLLAAFAFLWAVENVPRLLTRRPAQWLLHADTDSARARQLHRALTQLVLLGMILLYPLLRGDSVRGYYADLLGRGSPRQALLGAALSIFCLSLLYLAWLFSDNIEFAPRHASSRWLRKLAAAPLTALLGAAVEELLFRGILLADLLRSLPPAPAIVSGSVIFALAHYARRVKRYWTFPGHLLLGVLLCTAYVRTDALWLGFGLHAGGIALLSGTRPFIRYRGPAWLVGASIFPYAGLAGLVLLALLTGVVWTRLS